MSFTRLRISLQRFAQFATGRIRRGGHARQRFAIAETILAIDVTPMANRANRQNVIFVIEKIENPIITDSETKFFPAL
jgi:hypothetical protein